MATKKAAPAKKAAKAPARPAFKPGKEPLNRTALVSTLSELSGADAKTVKAVLGSLDEVITGSVSKKGSGVFVMPGLVKISVAKVPAKPKRKGVNPFTGQEQWFAAKPASMKVKIRPLKKLKDAAA